MKYVLFVGLLSILCGSVQAHPCYLMTLLNKLKSHDRYHPIGEYKPLLPASKQSSKELNTESDIPLLAKDPVARMRYIWGFELSLF